MSKITGVKARLFKVPLDEVLVMPNTERTAISI